MHAVPTAPDSTARRCATVLVVGLLLSPAAAGCSAQDSAREATTGHARDIRMVPRDRVREGGTLRWAVDALPATLNSFQFDANQATDQVAGATLPALFTADSRGRPRMNTDYLEAAEITDREPLQTVVYRLHDDARWQDGRPISVGDFTAQWRALNGTDKAYSTARNAGYDRIAKIARGAGEREVKVTFARPYADWKSLFTPLYPRALMESPDAFNDRARQRLEVSGGPFAVKELDRRAKTVTLERNPRWWGDRAKLDRIVFTAVDRSQRVEALSDGRVDLAEVHPADAERIEGVARGKAVPGVPAIPLSTVLPAHRAVQPGTAAERAREAAREVAVRRERLRGYSVRRAFGSSYTQLSLNGASGPLTDLRVRRAIARAIDRGALAREALRPAGLPGEPLGSHLHLLDQDGYRDSSGALGDLDVENAQALLAEAGLGGWEGGAARLEELGDTQRDAKAERDRAGEGDGKGAGEGDRQPLTLRLVIPYGPGSEPLWDSGRRIGEMLREVGVRTKIEKVRGASYFEEVIAAGNFDLALYSWPATPFPATDARPIYAKPQVEPGGTLLVEQNYSRVGTDHINQLFDQATGELDPKEQADLLHRADARIWAVAGSVPLYQRAQLVATRSELSNAGAFGMESPRYEDIGYLER